MQFRQIYWEIRRYNRFHIITLEPIINYISNIKLASNLLCRLPQPRKFLTEIPSFLTMGGCLVLISPYSWLEEYTAKEEWIGGLKDSEESIIEVSLFMSKHEQSLELLHRQDMPFLIREHERKYQYGVSDCTVWKKTL